MSLRPYSDLKYENFCATASALDSNRRNGCPELRYQNVSGLQQAETSYAVPDAKRRSFDMRPSQGRLMDQLDAVERQFLARAKSCVQ